MGSVSTVSASVHSRLMTSALSDHRPCYGRQQIQPPRTLGMAVSVVTIAFQPRHRQGDFIHLSERSEGFPPGLGFLRNIPFRGLCCSGTLKENTPSVSVFSRTASAVLQATCAQGRYVFYRHTHGGNTLMKILEIAVGYLIAL